MHKQARYFLVLILESILLHLFSKKFINLYINQNQIELPSIFKTLKLISNIKNSKEFTISSRDKFFINNQYMINNNLAQYSAYLIIDHTSITIEAFVQFYNKYVNYEHFGSKENFTCVLKLLSYNDKMDDTFIELEAVDSPKFYWIINKKLIFNLDLKILKSDYEVKRDRDLILKNIGVAIIWKHDYNKLLNDVTVVKDTRIVLPYSLINYQIPSIIYSKIPRLKFVSACVHFVYSQTPFLKKFIAMVMVRNQRITTYRYFFLAKNF